MSSATCETNNNQQTTQSIADYLAQLLKDRKQLAAFPNVFIHIERLLDEEISKVRASLFQINGVRKEPLTLPDAEGTPVTLNEKVYVPVKEHPDFNFVGRILGPRGMTAKQLEQETGCKIMVRGKGSMRDKKKEDANRGKPNWEHLSDELHVLITVEDTENRAQKKLERAVEEVQKLLIPQADGEDELKKRQLMELAIINGTYRDSTIKTAAAEDSYLLACEEEWRRLAASAAETRMMSPSMPGLSAQQLRSPAAPLGAPLILSPRMSVPTTAASLLSASAPPTMEHPGLIYATPYGDYNYALAAGNPLLTEYADHSDQQASPSAQSHAQQQQQQQQQQQSSASATAATQSPPTSLQHHLQQHHHHQQQQQQQQQQHHKQQHQAAAAAAAAAAMQQNLYALYASPPAGCVLPQRHQLHHHHHPIGPAATDLQSMMMASAAAAAAAHANGSRKRKMA